MNCTKCGEPLRENAKFCTKCGQKVMVEAAAQQELPATPEKKVEEPALPQDINSVNGRIYWNIQPGQIARVITEAELDSYRNVSGIIVQEGTIAFIRSNGKTIASISGGTYDLVSKTTATTNNIKENISNGWSNILNIFRKKTPEVQKDPGYQEQQEAILKSARNKAAFSVVILLEKAFPLIIGQKMEKPDDYKEVVPMKIQTRHIAVDVILNAYFKIKDHDSFIRHYLTAAKDLNTCSIVHEISDTVRRAIQDALYDKEIGDTEISKDLYAIIKENINQAGAETFFGLSLARIVEVGVGSKDLERFRALSAEMYLSEQELDYLVRTNDFKNRLAQTVNNQKIQEARSEQELQAALHEINKDNLLRKEELDKFTHELNVSAEQRAQALQTMRLKDSIEFERIRLQGETDKAIAIVKADLEKQGLLDEYKDSRFYKELDQKRASAELDLDLEQRRRQMERDDDDARFQQFMAMAEAQERARENERRNEAERERLKWEKAENLDPEKIWALQGGQEAATAYAQGLNNVKAEREANARIEEIQRHTQDQYFQMMNTMLGNRPPQPQQPYQQPYPQQQPYPGQQPYQQPYQQQPVQPQQPAPGQTIICPTCGTVNPVTMKFCGNCGTKLA